MSKVQELREKRARLHAEAQLLLPAKGQAMRAENKLKFDSLLAEMDTLKAEIDGLESTGDAESRWRTLDEELRQTTRPPEAQIGAGDPGEEKRYTKAFDGFLRNGILPNERGSRGISAEDRSVLQARLESRDQSVGTDAAGGYLVPTGFSKKLEIALKWYGSMLESSSIMNTDTGQSLPYPTTDDTSTVGEQVAENTQVTTADVTVGNITFGAFKYSTKMVRCSLELLQDSYFDIDSFLADQFARRLGRILNTKFTTGAGTTEPKGILTAATSGVAAATGSSGNTGGSETGATSIGTTDLVELEHSVDVSYRKGAAWMMHDSTLKAIKELLDKYGRPLWQPGLTSGAPDTILGYPYYINNDLPTIQASAKTVLFGNLKKYLVRRVMDLRVLRLTERYADYGQVAFLGFARYDGNLLDAGTHPVKYLVQHS